MQPQQFGDLLREYSQRREVPSFSAPAALVRHGGTEPEQDQELTTTSMMPSRHYSVRAESMMALGTVYPLVKREGSAFEHIGIGRAPNVDVQLPLIGVSKYHAYIRRLDSGEYTLADAGSQNGTRVLLQRLEPRVPVTIASGARIYFAHHLFTFVNRAGLLDLLRAQALERTGSL